MNNHLVVLAIGGNSLIKEKNHISISYQYDAIKETAGYIADMVAFGLDVAITHGNGPQVGFAYRRGELSTRELPLIPLDSCGANTQGDIGYMIEKALMNIFRRRGIKKKVIAVSTQTLVDRNDASFLHPTKPIGSFMSEEEARIKQIDLGWDIIEDAGRGYRRVVPSPLPIEIIELDIIKFLVNTGFIVVAAGGGGIPVIRNENGDIEGVEAVIDKDLGSSLLAKNLGAGTLIISTAVDAVYLHFGQKNQKALKQITLQQIKKYLTEGHFKPGSMKPKIEAIIRFLEGGGEKAIITSPENLLKAIRGDAGTMITL